jgi:hypothetical protein
MYDYYYSQSASIITEYSYSVVKYPYLWVPLLILDLPGYYKVLLSTLLHTPGQDMYGAPIHVQCWGVEHLTQQPWYLSQDYILDNLYLYSKLTIITLHLFIIALLSSTRGNAGRSRFWHKKNFLEPTGVIHGDTRDRRI